MSLTVGSVTVSRAANVVSRSGSGLALALFDVEVALWTAQRAALVAAGAPDPDASGAGDTAAADVKQAVWTSYKVRAEGVATAIIAHITANGVVSSTIPAASINATDPAAPVAIAGAIS